MHDMPSTEPIAGPAALRAKRRAAWAGVWLNGPLALAKIAGGYLAHSQALIADGVHSLSDLASDAAVLWALGHSHRPPDDEHPFGHGRFETLATLAVAAMLALAAAGIVIDAGLRVIDPPEATPGMLALWVAAGSILFKEALFHYTNAVARRTGSAMMAANAWHHRSDAISSVVALVGIGMAMAGWPWMDALAAAVIALMLARIAWGFGRPAVAELVDAAPDTEMAETVSAALAATPGVRDVHDLRLRQLGGAVQADVHLGLDPDLTLSEAHRLCEAARARVLAEVPAVDEIVIHPEPHGHADGFGAHRAALRPAVRETVVACLDGLMPDSAITALHLDYRNDGIRATVVFERAVPEGTDERAGARLADLRAAGRTDLVSLRLLGSNG
ncbi:MAG: cation transporter [Pararhodobacter sp.]|nr:cation transporter [Pararhodobacter sp.]